MDDWLRGLSDENRRLAKDRGFEPVRAEAERRADAAGAAPRVDPEEGEPAALAGLGPAAVRGPLPDYGTPAYLGLPEERAAPVLTLRGRYERRTRELLGDSALWLGLLAAATFLAYSPGLAARLRPFWPEPLLLAGALAWYRSGLTAAAALLLLLGAGARLLTLAGGARRFLARRRQLAAPPSSTTQAAGA